MISPDLVDLSRLQFAFTSMYHFIFVPLTLGLSFMLVVMEGCYLVTGRDVYKDMTRFWGKLFGINFALGVATGITMEFQFGTKAREGERDAGGPVTGAARPQERQKAISPSPCCSCRAPSAGSGRSAS